MHAYTRAWRTNAFNRNQRKVVQTDVGRHQVLELEANFTATNACLTVSVAIDQLISTPNEIADT